MKRVRICAQGDDLIVEIPDDMASELNWGVGTELVVEHHQDSMSLKVCKGTVEKSPNHQTHAAMSELDEGKGQPFSSVDDLFDDLMHEPGRQPE